jgi:hypothetical protein
VTAQPNSWRSAVRIEFAAEGSSHFSVIEENPRGNKMALFFPGNSQCPICNTAVGGSEDFVATTEEE